MAAVTQTSFRVFLCPSTSDRNRKWLLFTNWYRYWEYVDLSQHWPLALMVWCLIKQELGIYSNNFFSLSALFLPSFLSFLYPYNHLSICSELFASMIVDLILEIPLHCNYTWQTGRWCIKWGGRVWRGAGCWLWEATEFSNWWQRQTVLLLLADWKHEAFQLECS